LVVKLRFFMLVTEEAGGMSDFKLDIVTHTVRAGLLYLAELWNHEDPIPRLHVRRVIRKALMEIGLWDDFKFLLVFLRE